MAACSFVSDADWTSEAESYWRKVATSVEQRHRR